MQFFIEGKPQSKLRARTVRNQYTGKVHSYTPKKTMDYENKVRWSYTTAGGKYYGDKPLRVSIQAFYPIPKGFNKVKRENALSGIIRPQTKPDCDNVVKGILDALNGIAYHDDNQVVSVSCDKYYAETGHVIVNIKEI